MNHPLQTLRHSLHCVAGNLLVVLLLLMAHNATATLLFYDGFDYTVGEELGETVSSPPWENDKSQFTVLAGNLDYPGLQASAGNRVNADATSPSLDSVRTATGEWTEQTGGTLYISFLLRLQSTSSIGTSGDGTSLLTLSRTSNNTQLLGINLLNDGAPRLGVLKYPSDSSPVSSSAFFSIGTGANLSANGSTTYLVVAKYEWVAGNANDFVTVWINPTNLGVTEDPGNKVSSSAGTDGTQSAGRITLSRGPNTNIDELRIGQTWAEVTPSSGSVVPQAPVITESFLSPQGFVLRGTNGTPDGVYQVLSSQDILQSVATWPAASTNQFDSLGDFDSTNPVPVGAAMNYYRLWVGGELPTAPAITTQPMSRTVIVGQNAPFSVAATGTEPLSYQWYFDGAEIPGATINAYTVSNAQTNDVGGYQVIISNSIGSVTSVVASLTVVAAPTLGTPDAYATLNGGTTGGEGGPTVTVDNFADFEFYVDNNSGPYIVQVQGTINLGSSNVRIRDNKTIIGVGTDATLVGNLKVFRNNNVIIQNLNFTNPSGVGDGDGLTLHESLNVWVDHCSFTDCDDGNLDIAHGTDWVTVSSCHFSYTDPANDHRFSNLVGHSDSSTAEAEDTGKLHITFHHNWWGQLVHERMPRVRFGRVHVYNNYYNSPGNNNCIRAARDCEILVENNYFDTVKNVWERYVTVGLDGKVFATNNFETNTYWSAGSDSKSVQIPGTDILSSDANGLNPPPYPYVLDLAADVPNLVTNTAGAGKGPFAP